MSSGAGERPRRTIIENGCAAPFLGRRSLCLSSAHPEVVSHVGDKTFASALARHYEPAQSNAVERLVELKADLRNADTESFWRVLTAGMTSICQAEYGFVTKRIFRDDQNPTIEMPPLGEPGSCLHGIVSYHNNGTAHGELRRDFKYVATGSPCATMKHEKVSLIPEKLRSFIPHNPTYLPFPAEAYLAIPLFVNGKCLAHFGLIWSESGLSARDVSWAYTEMLLHSLEDLVAQRIGSGETFVRPASRQAPRGTGDSVRRLSIQATEMAIQQNNPMNAQSFKPYARSLSHELRTPMQGVVGMLDVMHATVQENIIGRPHPKVGPIFQELKDHIEVVQDSARRAVEAADNVVHAYDLNMQIPDTPQQSNESEANGSAYFPAYDGDGKSATDTRPNILIEGSNIPVNPNKRRRNSQGAAGAVPKQRIRKSDLFRELSPRSEVKNAVQESEKIVQSSPGRLIEEVMVKAGASRPSLAHRRTTSRLQLDGDGSGSVLRNTKIRDLLRLVINESLHVGGRPDSTIGEATTLGERIVVESRSPNGKTSTKVISWAVDPSVPEILLVDDRDLAKLISCLFLNAVKFTETGEIDVFAKMSTSSFITITVHDTGTGIPEDFLPYLFKPFSREDDSTTRSKEGLGLGLLVAKGLSRKIGGDLVCVRSSTSGPDRGSEFEIKLPINTRDAFSVPATPYNRTPTPSQFHLSSSYFGSARKADYAASVSPTASERTTPPSPRHLSSPRANGVSRPLVAKGISCPDTPGQLSPTASTRGAAHIKDGLYDSQLARRHPLTFLVAEDNKINRRILVNMLGKLGYKDVYEAYDGKEAVRIMGEILSSDNTSPLVSPSDCQTESDSQTESGSISTDLPESQKCKARNVDVILMDLWMPEMDGYEATSRIFDMVEEHNRRRGSRNSESEAQRPTPPTPPSSEKLQTMVELGESAVDDDRADLRKSPTVLAVSADVTDEALGRATQVGMEGYMTKPYKIPDLERLIIEFCGNDRVREESRLERRYTT